MDGSIVLGRSQRNRLLDLYRKDPSPCVRLRAHVILLLSEGHAWTLICAVLFCSSATVARWKQRFEDGGVAALLAERRQACDRARGRPQRLRIGGSRPQWSSAVRSRLTGRSLSSTTPRGTNAAFGCRALQAQHSVGHRLQPAAGNRIAASITYPVCPLVELGQRRLHPADAPRRGGRVGRFRRFPLDRGLPGRLRQPQGRGSHSAANRLAV